MKPGKFDLYLRTNGTFTFAFTWQAGGTPVDLTGYEALLQVRESPGTPVLLEMSTTNGRITLGGSAGTVAGRVEQVDVAALAGSFFSAEHDIVFTAPGGTRIALLAGRACLEIGDTQP